MDHPLKSQEPDSKGIPRVICPEHFMITRQETFLLPFDRPNTDQGFQQRAKEETTDTSGMAYFNPKHAVHRDGRFSAPEDPEPSDFH